MASSGANAPDGQIVIRMPRTGLPVLGLAILAALAILWSLDGQRRGLEREAVELREERDAAVARERELAQTVARQYRELRDRSAELDGMRLQVEAVEMQLDGVELLHRSLREEMGLPPPAVLSQAPAGGPYDARTSLADRLDIVRSRLGVVMSGMISAGDQARIAALVDQAGQAAASGELAVVAEPEPFVETPANWPARGAVTSPFGWRLFRGRPNLHTGIDVALPHGSQVLSTGRGVVVGSGWQPGYGWCVLVQHGADYSTLYAHLSRTLVEVGDRVEPGGLLGLSGSSGNSTGPHLHYEIWERGRVIDPRPLMDGGGAPRAD